ncbi:MAG TPA: hypothetical protein PKK40_05820 [Marmoricola sp.]|nr:hypothetical protein [Marmoricola sp.]
MICVSHEPDSRHWLFPTSNSASLRGLIFARGWLFTIVSATALLLAAAYFGLIALVLRRGEATSCACFGALAWQIDAFRSADTAKAGAAAARAPVGAAHTAPFARLRRDVRSFGVAKLIVW